MAQTIHVFDETLQVSERWLRSLMQRLGTDDPHRALKALRVTLHALRDQLSTAAAAGLAAQLPMVLRGLFFESWQPDGARPQSGDLLGRIAESFADEEEARTIARAVVGVLAEHISIGTLGATMHALPPEVRAIWVDEKVVVRPPR